MLWRKKGAHLSGFILAFVFTGQEGWAPKAPLKWVHIAKTHYTKRKIKYIDRSPLLPPTPCSSSFTSRTIAFT
uniref:Putative secreted protein n=1 Tax=Ixodes ricinus TaxID=34613 RepID=A0A6B0U3A6_IXORI